MSDAPSFTGSDSGTVSAGCVLVGTAAVSLAAMAAWGKMQSVRRAWSMAADVAEAQATKLGIEAGFKDLAAVTLGDGSKVNAFRFRDFPAPVPLAEQMQAPSIIKGALGLSQRGTDLAIVGSGIHGTELAVRARELGIDRLMMVDKHPRPLWQWENLTGSQRTGMEFLRSPATHLLGNAEAGDSVILNFGRRYGNDHKVLFRYDGLAPLPSLKMFNTQTQSLVRTYGLDKASVQASVNEIKLSDKGVTLITDQGPIHAGKAILAVSNNDRPFIPQWAAQLKKEGGRVEHLFEPGFNRTSIGANERVVVVGGGISAGQVTGKIVDQAGSATLLTRRPLIGKHFDSNPFFMHQEGVDAFSAVPSSQVRSFLQQNRYPGTLSHSVFKDVSSRIENGSLKHVVGDVQSAKVLSNGTIDLVTSQGTINADRVVLSTGFEKSVPGGEMVQKLIRSHSLPVAEDGFPVVDQALRWHPNLFVTGRLAERTVGPPAPNIIGAKWSALRMNEPLSEFRAQLGGSLRTSKDVQDYRGFWYLPRNHVNMERYRPTAVNDPVYYRNFETLGPLPSRTT